MFDHGNRHFSTSFPGSKRATAQRPFLGSVVTGILGACGFFSQKRWETNEKHGEFMGLMDYTGLNYGESWILS